MSDETLDAKKVRLAEVTRTLERSKVELKQIKRNRIIVIVMGILGLVFVLLKIITNITGILGVLISMIGIVLTFSSGTWYLQLYPELNLKAMYIEKLSADKAELEESIAEAEKEENEALH